MTDLDQLVTCHLMIEATVAHPYDGILKNSFCKTLHGNIFFPWTIIKCCGKSSLFKTCIVFKVNISVNNTCGHRQRHRQTHAPPSIYGL